MARPLKLFCYKLGRELHIDVDVIMSWPTRKIYEYMAFFRTETDEFKAKIKEENMTPEERTAQMLKMLGA